MEYLFKVYKNNGDIERYYWEDGIYYKVTTYKYNGTKKTTQLSRTEVSQIFEENQNTGGIYNE